MLIDLVLFAVEGRRDHRLHRKFVAEDIVEQWLEKRALTQSAE